MANYLHDTCLQGIIRSFSKGWARANWLAVRMILPAWFDHLEECFSYREFQFKKFCLPVKTSYPPAENIKEIPESW